MGTVYFSHGQTTLYAVWPPVAYAVPWMPCSKDHACSPCTSFLFHINTIPFLYVCVSTDREWRDLVEWSWQHFVFCVVGELVCHNVREITSDYFLLLGPYPNAPRCMVGLCVVKKISTFDQRCGKQVMSIYWSMFIFVLNMVRVTINCWQNKVIRDNFVREVPRSSCNVSYPA